MPAMNCSVVRLFPAIVTWVMLTAAVSFGQFPGLPKVPGMRAIPAPGGVGNLGMVDVHPALILMRDKKVQQELGLLESQMQQLDVIRKRSSQELHQALLAISYPGLPNKDRRPVHNVEAIRTALADSQRKTTAEIERVLVPHQLPRLRQLQFQSEFSNAPLRAYASAELARDLGISKEQHAALADRIGEIERSLSEKIKQAQEEAASQARGLLTEEQRSKFDELSGRPFDFSRD